MTFFTYILYSTSADKYYIGSTGDMDDRLKRHNQGRSKATKFGVPWTLVYQKAFGSRSGAVQHEKYIKTMKSRKYIEKLIKAE